MRSSFPPAGPRGEHGRGLLIVRSLSCRLGVCGDERGRLVWAEVPWTGDGNGAPGLLPVGYEAAVRADEAALVQRFAGVPVWFGRSTLQWWAMLRPARGRRLLAARSAGERRGGRAHGARAAPAPRHVAHPWAGRPAVLSVSLAVGLRSRRCGEAGLGPRPGS